MDDTQTESGSVFLTELDPEPAPAEAKPQGVFVHRETGTVIRILDMDESYVRYISLDGTGRMSLPRAQYDTEFGKWWRPAGVADVVNSLDAEGFEPPKVIPDDWG